MLRYKCVVAVVVLLYYSSQAEAETAGFLRFVDLNDPRISVNTVHSGDNHNGYIGTNRFPFGNSSVYSVHVSTNGYFSMGERPVFNSLPNFPIPNNKKIVAPFGADIDTSTTGRVRYADLTEFGSYHRLTTDVVSFIRSTTLDDYFSSQIMVVAEWDFVPHRNNPLETNRFQGILTSDGTASYAVFIYECGEMDWGGGVIGWQASSSNYVSHSLSGENDSNSIGCLYSKDHSAIIYRISACDSSSEYTCDDRQCIYDFVACNDRNDCTDGSDEQDCVCRSYEFTCDNGECIFDSDACDGIENCADGSDENGCPPLDDFQVLAVIFGVGGGVFVLLGIFGIVGAIYCIKYRRNRSAIQTTVGIPCGYGQPLQPVAGVYQPQQAAATYCSGNLLQQGLIPNPTKDNTTLM